MPVYFVTGVELEGRPREFEHESDAAITKGDHFHNRPQENAPLRVYVAKRVAPDPSGRYDGLIDADQIMASGIG